MIRKIKLRGFKSHENTELELSYGTNVLLGIMGSGKSSLLQALTFGLFGEVPESRSRKVSMKELIMRKPKSLEFATIEVEFSENDIIYQVKRVLGEKKIDAKLFEEGKVIEVGQKRVTQKISEILGTDFETFTNVVYARQNEIDNFLRYGKTDRVKLIDSLLKIDRLDDARKKLKSFHSNIKGKLDELKNHAKKDISETEELLAFSASKVSKLRDEFTELQMEASSVKERLSINKMKFEKLDLKRKRRDNLKNKLSQLKGEAGSLDEYLTSLPKIENAKSKFEVTSIRFNEFKTKLKETISKLSLAKSRKDFLTPRVNELLGFTEIAKKIPLDFSKKIDSLQTSLSNLIAKRDSHTSSLLQLKGAEAKCPVCDHELKDPKVHKKRHIDAIETLGGQISALKASLINLKNEARLAEKEALEIERAKLMIRELPKLKSELESINTKKLEDEYNTINEKVNELEKKKLELEKASEREEKSKKLEKLYSEISVLQSKLSTLGFDESNYASLRQTVWDLSSSMSSLTSRMQVIPNIIEAKESEMAALRREIDEVKLARAEVEKTYHNLEKLALLVNSLSDVQVLVRRGFIELINELLGDVWYQLYPYGDYSSLRIKVEQEGKRTGDYVLQLREKKGWINVDGFASGGERSIASLALRVAFAKSLSKLGLLLLDEPTHNLDENGVDKLSDVLREGMPNVLEQVVIITHEERMEKASTGAAYRLFRNKAKEEPTHIESL